jgi:hypothetical protein
MEKPEGPAIEGADAKIKDYISKVRNFLN